MNASDLKAILSAFMEQVWNKGDFSNLENYMLADYEIKDDPGDPWNGLSIDMDTFKERVGVAYSRNAFPDLYFDIREMISEDEKVVVSWSMTGTHQGNLPQLPATGKSFSISGITIYYFKDGKIQGHTQAFDRLGFLSQIGFMG